MNPVYQPMSKPSSFLNPWLRDAFKVTAQNENPSHSTFKFGSPTTNPNRNYQDAWKNVKTEENRRVQTSCSQVQKQFSCIACQTVHQTSVELQDHLKTREHLSRTMISPLRQETPKMKPVSNFQSPMESYCPVCNIRFKGSLVLHRASAEHKEVLREGRPKCHVCNMSFRSLKTYQNHLKSPIHKDFLEKQTQENANTREVCQGINDEIVDEAFDIQHSNNSHQDTILSSTPTNEKPTERVENSLQTNSATEADKVDNLIEFDTESTSSNTSSAMEYLQSITSSNQQQKNDENLFAEEWTGNKEVGISALRPLLVLVCRVCGLCFETREVAMTHCRSEDHFYKFRATQIKKEK